MSAAYTEVTTEDRVAAARIAGPEYVGIDGMNDLYAAAGAVANRLGNHAYYPAIVAAKAEAVRIARRHAATTGEFDADLPAALRAAANTLRREIAGIPAGAR